MGTETLRILITDGQELAALGATRSLGQAGHRVTVGCADGSAAVRWSRHRREVVTHPDPWRQHTQYRDWLRQQLERGGFDVILPLTEASMLAADALREQTPAGLTLLIPDRSSLKFALSKVESSRRAQEAGATVAESRFLDPSESLAEWCEQVAGLGYPVVIKADNLLDEGVYRKGPVYRADSAADAGHILRFLRFGGFRVMAQRFVVGRGVGAFFLRWDGEVRLWFAHRRLHEVPYTGGYSSLRESSRDEDVVSGGARLLEAMAYQGLAMIEWRRAQPDGRNYFVEVNGRLWGSLALALHCGVDFPRAYLEWARFGHSAVRQPDYRPGVKCRNLFPSELSHLLSVVKGARGKPRGDRPSVGKALAEQVALTVNPRVKHDHLWLSDPLPGVAQAALLVRYSATKGVGLLRSLVRNQRRRRTLALLERTASRVQTDLPELLRPDGGAVLFLCHGNICRSPFAEHYWNKRRVERNLNVAMAKSAGLVTQAGGRTPRGMRGLAAAFGVALDEHRSRPLSEGDVHEAKVVFVMDYDNYRSVLSQFPHLKDKVYLLAAVSGESDGEIADPYMLSPPAAMRSYEKLARSIDAVHRFCQTVEARAESHVRGGAHRDWRETVLNSGSEF